MLTPAGEVGEADDEKSSKEMEFLRVATYGVLAILAYRSAMWAHLLAGVFVADVVWRTVQVVLVTALTTRIPRCRVLLEGVLLFVVGCLWAGAGHPVVPGELEAKAMTLLGMLAVMCGSVAPFVRKLAHEGTDALP